jgi:myo-inositol-1(or 4)-monophosphatase
MELKKIKIIAIKNISQVGEILKKEYEKFDRNNIKLKAKHEIVTKYDLLAEKMITQEIKKHFPGHQILAEESGANKNKSDFLWVIDPIDGTTNFSIHNPLWSISVALLYKKEVVLGIILAPMLNELYVAEKGQGAYLNGKKIKVSTTKKNKNINTFCHSRKKSDIKKAIKYFSYQKLNGLDCRQLGSAAIELAYVACGRVDSLVIPGANSWDVAAGALLVEEAGGIVTDFKNKKWSLKSPNLIASNKNNQQNIIKIIKKLKV